VREKEKALYDFDIKRDYIRPLLVSANNICCFLLFSGIALQSCLAYTEIRKGVLIMTSTKELVKTERKERMLSPFDEFERWFEDMWTRPSSLFGSLWPETRLTEMKELSPSVDIYEEGSELVLKADMPGVPKEEVKVEVSDNMLTISGEKKKEEKIEKENFFRYERSHGSFCRSFELPEGTDTEKMKAHFENGVLEVRIPKAEEMKTKKKTISIE
jgi:HSP20 family protein